jgi:hypothetical protein
MSKMTVGRIFLLLFLVAGLARSAAASDPQNVFEGQLVGVPVYDPGSKRYFALERPQLEPQQFTMWPAVEKQAEDQSYKGVRGRLAIVDSAEVHEFLLRTFRPNQYQFIWIGMRYMCDQRKLVTVDGRTVPQGGFLPWDKNWHPDPYACKDHNRQPEDFAPVAYTPNMKSWIILGRDKGYPWYFIEFPTGHE